MISTACPERLVLPKNLDTDIKQRLSIDGIMEVADLEGTGWTPETFSSRLRSGWTETEINYLLYGKQQGNILVCTGFYPKDYNFFHYLDPNNPEEMARDDICPEEREFVPHLHSFLNNPDKNPYPDQDFLGWLHNHFIGGYSIKKRMGTVESVGFSPPDWDWINRYAETYGANNRRLAFVIYYSSPKTDFYKGLVLARDLPPTHLEVAIE